MDIKLIADVLKEEVKATFPNGFKTPEDRLLAIYRQVAEVSAMLARRRGHSVTHNLGVRDEAQYHQCVFSILIDVLLLSEEVEIDYDKELQVALEWFRNKRKKA
jgi:hypothetical protein